MVWVPFSFYLSILAGIFVLFNHYASSETGDVALNKVTGAAGRFYALFRDTAITLQHGCTSRLESVLCGPAMDSVLPHDVAEYLRVHYCDALEQDSESTAGGTSNDRQRHGGYGSSDFAFVRHQPHVRPLGPRTSTENPSRQSLFGCGWSSQCHHSRAVWDWSSKVMVTIGELLLRTWASYWWFKVPLKATGVLLAAYYALSAFDYLIGARVVTRFVSQMYMTVMVDFLQCIKWEAQRHILDIGAVIMQQVYGVVTHPRQRAKTNAIEVEVCQGVGL